jgi:hypothetical protein
MLKAGQGLKDDALQMLGWHKFLTLHDFEAINVRCSQPPVHSGGSPAPAPCLSTYSVLFTPCLMSGLLGNEVLISSCASVGTVRS